MKHKAQKKEKRGIESQSQNIVATTRHRSPTPLDFVGLEVGPSLADPVALAGDYRLLLLQVPVWMQLELPSLLGSLSCPPPANAFLEGVWIWVHRRRMPCRHLHHHWKVRQPLEGLHPHQEVPGAHFVAPQANLESKFVFRRVSGVKVRGESNSASQKNKRQYTPSCRMVRSSCLLLRLPVPISTASCRSGVISAPYANRRAIIWAT